MVYCVKLLNFELTYMDLKLGIGHCNGALYEFFISESEVCHAEQSGTKPNLVAKIWLPTLVSSLWYM